MTTEFKGKMLVRPATTKEGKPVVILCGVFEPNQPIESFDPKDEMWACHLDVVDAIKFLPKEKLGAFSPEDFLENLEGASDASNWNRKEST